MEECVLQDKYFPVGLKKKGYICIEIYERSSILMIAKLNIDFVVLSSFLTIDLNGEGNTLPIIYAQIYF